MVSLIPNNVLPMKLIFLAFDIDYTGMRLVTYSVLDIDSIRVPVFMRKNEILSNKNSVGYRGKPMQYRNTFFRQNTGMQYHQTYEMKRVEFLELFIRF